MAVSAPVTRAPCGTMDHSTLYFRLSVLWLVLVAGFSVYVLMQ
jgi:hypothetical protein